MQNTAKANTAVFNALVQSAVGNGDMGNLQRLLQEAQLAFATSAHGAFAQQLVQLVGEERGDDVAEQLLEGDNFNKLREAAHTQFKANVLAILAKM